MKKMMNIVFYLAAVVFLSGVCIAGGAKEEKAVKAADAWLKLVDDGKYNESWETAAQYFKNSLTSAQWEQAVSPVRQPLGKVRKRTVKSKEYRTALPGAPDGEYVVIQYATSFENKNSAVETVTPMLDKDGTWRVSGYYIK
ncbi:MAG: DUF4019 domain-containing protein [Thermodesulfovibrionales bacterium]|nr:DUF4019 domain-containing protein [Thermodesulfovibrionales bacterium]